MTHFPPNQIAVIADNVSDETFAWLGTYPFASLKRTALGNSASFWESFCDALALADDCAAYFVENDYLHRTGARAALLEGLQIADYVTLYDHPDKYVDGINPLVRRGGEVSRVNLTASCHWKTTNSTTMTFAARVGTLRKDRLIFRNFTVGTLPGYFPGLRRFQRKRVPGDYPLFRALARLSGRTLSSPIPAYSTHGETAYIAPFFMDMLEGSPDRA